MNTNDLPLAQKLAALMEAGRVAHPELKHGRGNLRKGDKACAMAFVMLGAGLEPVSSMNETYEESCTPELAAALGVDREALIDTVRRVIHMNDSQRAELPKIIQALREDALPDVPIYSIHTAMSDYMENMASQHAAFIKSFAKLDLPKYTFVGVDSASMWTAYDPADLPKITVKTIGEGKPAKHKVRQSAKTGATWPVAKHAYA